MKISTRGHYGTRAMLELALHYGSKPLNLTDIAKTQEIPRGYLEHIMASLLSAGLARSVRGKHGGFMLAKPPESITVNKVLRATEGPIGLVPCMENPKLCKRSHICVPHEIWKKLKKAMDNALDSVTLSDMVKMQKNKLKKPHAQVYYI